VRHNTRAKVVDEVVVKVAVAGVCVHIAAPPLPDVICVAERVLAPVDAVPFLVFESLDCFLHGLDVHVLRGGLGNT
jgi:hypothetical protein